MGVASLRAILALCLLAAAGAEAAFDGGPPQPPCAAGTPLDWPAEDAGPAVEVWHPADLPPGWRLADCGGLTPPGSAVLVTVVARLHHEGDAFGLLARLGRASEQKQLRYWSVRDQRWLPMLADATALSDPVRQRHRPDFKLDELLAGSALFLLYDDAGGPGPVVMDLEVGSAGPDGFLATARSVTPLILMGVTIARPGDLASLLAVRRLAPDEYGYYALSAASLAPVAAMTILDSTLANRAVASFRYLAGIPSDQEPPVVMR